jgi:adenylyltransferase/sulfurtransferase
MIQQISPRELARDIENGQTLCLLDVRQPWESDLASLPGSVRIPLNELPQRAGEVENNGKTVIVYCHHGIRSLSAASFLKRLGFTNVQSLAGGIDAWSCEVDPSIPRY